MVKIITLGLIGMLLPSSAVVYEAADSLVRENHLSAVNPEVSDPLDDLLVIDDFKTKYLFGEYASDPSADSFDVEATLEYGYSTVGSYSFYFYVFNLSGSETNYNFDYSGNRVEIFDESSGSYEHKNINYVSISSDKKFVKYRLDVLDQDFTRSDGARQYGIVGIEIASIKNSTTGTYELHDYGIGHSWVYTGVGDELQVDYADGFDYLSLDVNVGCYQTESSSESETSKNNLFYAYFAVPQTFAGDAYSLYSVHADYYDFDLSNRFAVVTDKHSYEFYQDLWNQYVADDGVLDDDERDAIGYYYDDENGTNNFIARYFFFNTYASTTAGWDDYKHFWWFDGLNTRQVWPYDSTHNLKTGNPYFFNVDSASDKVEFSKVDTLLDLDTSEALSGQSRSDVYKDIHYTSDESPINDASYIDWNLISYGDTHNGWENFWAGIRGVNTSESSIENISCIQKVEPDVLTNLDIYNENEYLVDSDDLLSLKSYYSSSLLSLKNTYIFRFDVNSYDSKSLGWAYQNGDSVAWTNEAGYFVNSYKVAVDFDVIDLTFVSDYGRLLQIPVVSDPQNVGSDLTPPPDGGLPWWVYLIIAIFGVLAFVWVISKLISLSSSFSAAGANYKIGKMRSDIKKRDKRR